MSSPACMYNASAQSVSLVRELARCLALGWRGACASGGAWILAPKPALVVLTRCALAVALLIVFAGECRAEARESGAAGQADTTPEATQAVAGADWPSPILFSTRVVSRDGPGFADGNPLAGKKLHVVSEEHPAVAAALGRHLASRGVEISQDASPGTVVVRVALAAWMMPPGMLGRTRADLDVASAVDEVLAAGSRQLALAMGSGDAGSSTLHLPLGGWKTPLANTGVSVGLAGFLLSNIASVSGLEHRVNRFFGADATGTICLGRERTCIRRKGPQQDYELQGTFELDGLPHRITAKLLLIQHDANIIQPLAYAIADWARAALGEQVPDCEYWRTGKRVPACEPVLDMVPLEGLL